jgi:putative transposase
MVRARSHLPPTGLNNRRLLEPIGNIPPAEVEAADYAALAQQAMAA